MKAKSKPKKPYAVEIDELKYNDAIMLNYRHELLVLKRQMVKEYNSEIIKVYRDNLDFIVGDRDITAELDYVINRIGQKWFMRFNYLSDEAATKFILQIGQHNKKRFDKIEKRHPFLLKSSADREQMVKILKSSIAENVSLIRSIPKKYHDDVLGDVMRSVGKGGNLQELTEALSKRSNLTSKRISLIARDQTAKATALIDRQNAKELGFEKAIWQKSIAGKTHRIDHAKAHNTEFDIDKGCLISGEYILPRMKINCKCSYKLVMD